MYPKIYNLGHPKLQELMVGPVSIQEKIDGSQISFGNIGGKLHIRSKNTGVNPTCPTGMFTLGAEYIQYLYDQKLLIDGYTYRGEYLQKPKHNIQRYTRTPYNYIILFDVDTGNDQYMKYHWVETEARRLGLEVVPLLYPKTLDSQGYLDILQTPSILGGEIEGFVIKNHTQHLMGKYVRENFREINHIIKRKNILDTLIETYGTEARWIKGVQHLRDRDLLEENYKDIGLLIKEIQSDITSECEDEIKDILWKWAYPQVKKGWIRGMPEWYKEKLLIKQCEMDARQDGLYKAKGNINCTF